MSGVGQYVVFFTDHRGGNVHHYYDTFEEAQAYMLQSSLNCEVAYVLAGTHSARTASTVDHTILEYLKSATP